MSLILDLCQTDMLRQLRHIPTVGGPSLPILSYIGVYNYYFNNGKTVQEGYDKVQSSRFYYMRFW